ncbi:MAG: BON domain-containing protein [Candidatus Thorarchaeota archaeon]|nr:BON domain-containing protein [Candidatus Thorarchaeota archaeon]
MKNTDEIIKKTIIDTLYWDSRVDASDVKVEVDNREVTIRGTVPNYSASEAALFDAYKAHGVTKVDNQLLVKYPQLSKFPTDKEIAKNIETQLALYASTRDSDIQVFVKDGKVILKGHVDAYWKKSRVEQLISDLIGVVGITNTITVVPTKTVVDDVIADDVVQAINRSYIVDVNDIDVRVQNGIVTLSGDVSNRVEYDAAIEAASNTFGVKDVIDRLHIK